MEDFISHIHRLLQEGSLFKLTLSKPRDKHNELRNIFLRPISLGDQLVWNATFRYTTNDKTQNLTSESLSSKVEQWLTQEFFNADLILPSQKTTLLQSKKGKSTILTTKEKHEIQLESHNRKKRRLIAETEPFLKDLGISSSNGRVFGHAQDKYKQINKFVELIAALLKNDQALHTIYDMGSGKGYLTFALHHYLTQRHEDVSTLGVELRNDLVQKCNAAAQKNGFGNLSFVQGSIADFTIKKADMVIALHACDIATDMAIAQGIHSDAKYIVVAPCCHKQIRKAMTKTNTNLNPLLQFGILKERQAEMITDTIRALLLESKGYEVNVFEFISSEHTGKNIMLTAKKTDKKSNAVLQKVAAIKEEFGIDEHYLEKLI